MINLKTRATEFMRCLLLGMLLCGLTAPAWGWSLFESYQPNVVVSDPYIELRTGPGRGYPIFYVAGQGDEITLLKRRTDWFKVRPPRAKEGWVHIEEMQHTLDREYYVERQVRPVAEPVLEALGLDFNQVIGDDRQIALF